MPAIEINGCEKLFKKSLQAKIRLGGESVSRMADRLRNGSTPASPCQASKSSSSDAPEMETPASDEEENESRVERL
jgi:hypothetical protein